MAARLYLKDVSATGARVEVEGSNDVLKSREFFMVLSSTGLAFRRCELVWINGSTVGVHFFSGKKKKFFGKKKKAKSAS
jgi:CII-binding regulator of phage lambda lysogenization HflD